MPSFDPDVTDAELAILDDLWRRSPATIRDIADRLYPKGGTSAYATVQKLLERLEKKGCVRRDRQKAAHLFRAAVQRDDMIHRRLQDLADRLCGGSLTPLLTQLVRGRRLGAKERQAIDRLIDDFDTPGAGAADGGKAKP